MDSVKDAWVKEMLEYKKSNVEEILVDEVCVE